MPSRRLSPETTLSVKLDAPSWAATPSPQTPPLWSRLYRSWPVPGSDLAEQAAGRWVGRGDKNGADGVAVNAMRSLINTVGMSGVVVIGEGEKDIGLLLAAPVAARTAGTWVRPVCESVSAEVRESVTS